MPSIFERLDHLVYATPDLARTVREVGDLVGVRPSEGGRHPAWGTRNSLLALGPRMYLEVMGPDVDQPDPSRLLPFNMESLDRPRLVTWVCRAERLDELVERAKRVGIELGDIQAGSRRRPDGSTLLWTMTDLTMPREGGVVPYFINWGESHHPSESSPQGCLLEGLRAEHPEAERVQGILYHLGLGDLRVTSGQRPRLVASLETPLGIVELS